MNYFHLRFNGRANYPIIYMKRRVNIVVKKLSGAIALLTAELLIVSISFFISLSVLIIIIRQIFYRKEYNMDEKVFSYLSQYVTETNTSLMQFFSFFGSHFLFVPGWLLLIIFYYFINKNVWMSVKTLIIALSNVGLMFGLKLLFNRPRPVIQLLKDVRGLSFPSGHAFMSSVFYGFIIYLVYREVKNRWLKWIIIIMLVIIILIIGFSRVYLRVHYTSDVIAGYCFGIMSLLILLGLLGQIEKYNAKTIPPHLNITKADKGLT